MDSLEVSRDDRRFSRYTASRYQKRPPGFASVKFNFSHNEEEDESCDRLHIRLKATLTNQFDRPCIVEK